MQIEMVLVMIVICADRCVVVMVIDGDFSRGDDDSDDGDCLAVGLVVIGTSIMVCNLSRCKYSIKLKKAHK